VSRSLIGLLFALAIGITAAGCDPCPTCATAHATPHSDGGSYLYANTADPVAFADTVFFGDADTHAGAHLHIDGDAAANSEFDGNAADPQCDGHPAVHSDSDRNPDAEPDRDAHANRNSDANRNCVADFHCHGHANPKRDAHAFRADVIPRILRTELCRQNGRRKS
jgi:hypothetical protein